MEGLRYWYKYPPPWGEHARTQLGPLFFRVICPSPGKPPPHSGAFLSPQLVARALKEDGVLQWGKMQHFSNLSRSCVWNFRAIRGCIIKGKYYLEEKQISVLAKMGLVFEDYALRTRVVIP